MNDQQQSGLFQTVSKLGTALGIAAANFATPLLYGWGKPAITRYLTASFGADIAPWLLWTTGIIAAYVIYVLCKALITFALSWVMTALVARGLSND